MYWSCAQTHPRQEQLALINLRRQKFTAFFPFFLSKTKKGVVAVQPAFPGYVFIALDDTIRWAPINYTIGVRRLLTRQTAADEYLVPHRATFIDDLHKMRIMGCTHDPDLIPTGTTIMIKRGPFANRRALVTMSAAERIHVMLQVFNREVTLEIAASAVAVTRIDKHEPEAAATA